MMMMMSPVTYQGGKARIAEVILAQMKVPHDRHLYDLCCGSGAISIAAINNGHDVKKIHMVDKGPFGTFWELIGKGKFNIKLFEKYCKAIPTNPRKIKRHIERLYVQPVNPYAFLILQAGAFGGAPISIHEGRWKSRSGFRDYWLPTKTSNRKSPVNPMMPMPETILLRVKEIVDKMKGVNGYCADVGEMRIKDRSLVYIDPPYIGTTAYAFELNVKDLAQKIKSGGSAVFVSEGGPLTKMAMRLSMGRAKGGMTGNRSVNAHEEWLSRF